MLESDRLQYDREIASAERDLANAERSLQEAIERGVSPGVLDSFRQNVSKYRTALTVAHSRKSSDYYNMNSD